MTRAIVLAAALAIAPMAAQAHKLVVFASTDCEGVIVEAKFANGRVAKEGEVRVLDAENAVQVTLPLAEDGTARVPLGDVDATEGLLIEVDTGGHDNYWIVTPEDIARTCGS